MWGNEETVGRSEVGKQLARALGALREIHWTMGPYAIVAASEASDDETASAFAFPPKRTATSA